MNKPAISVLMPVYNAEKYLAEAIESILNQSFDDFEFIIIDDASTDTSSAIIHSYNDSRIRYYKNEQNLGISQTLNRGIDLARADWIARMDADDISFPNRLEKQCEYISKHPDSGMIFTWVQVITNDKKKIDIERFKPEHYYYNLTFECWIYHPTVVYKKASVIRAGKYATPYSEDFELFWQISRHDKIICVPQVLLYYRLSDESLHRVTKKKEYEEYQNNQVLRNIRYYTGDSVTINREELACLRHDFAGLPEIITNSFAVKCIKDLHLITNAITRKPNVNLDTYYVARSAASKENFILNYFLSNLSFFNGVRLLVQLNKWKRLLRYLKQNLTGRKAAASYKGPTSG